jgi:transposase
VIPCDAEGASKKWEISTVTRKKYQLRRERGQLQNQLAALLEEAHIKLSSFVSDLLGASARRMLKALAEGENNPAALAVWPISPCVPRLEHFCDVLGGCTDLRPAYRRLLKMALEQLQLLEQQIGLLDQELTMLNMCLRILRCCPRRTEIQRF